MTTPLVVRLVATKSAQNIGRAISDTTEERRGVMRSAPRKQQSRNSDAGSELLSIKAYRRIEEMIVTLDLPPGSVITEAQLSADLGIGRTPVREALQRIAQEGLVRLIRSRGFVVSEIDAKDQLRVLEARRCMERLVARLASTRATAEQKERFRALAHDFSNVRSKEDELRFIRLDREFNALLLDAAHNDYCRAMMATIQGISRRYFFRYKDALDIAHTAHMHGAIASEIAEGNATAAEEAVDALISYNEDFVRRSLFLP